MARVIAVERGHDGVVLREPGEEFDVDLTDKRFKDSTWFVEKDKAPAPKRVNPNDPPPGAGPKKGSRARADDPGDLA